MGSCVCGAPHCDLVREVKAVTVAMASRGDTVRVEFEAEYSGKPNPNGSSPGDKHMLKVNGKETWVPENAKVTVVKKAVPEEPPKGTVVVFPDGAVWARYGGYEYGWISLSTANDYDCRSWEKVVQTHGGSFDKVIPAGGLYWFPGVGPIRFL